MDKDERDRPEKIQPATLNEDKTDKNIDCADQENQVLDQRAELADKAFKSI